jgi:hypothetical protein
MAVRARILLLTEDSGRQGQPTVHKLLTEALKLLVEGVDLNPKRVPIEPLLKSNPACKALRANQWKEHPTTKQTIVLREAIAAHLLTTPGFVIFHFDTDRVWDERKDSENRKRFDVIIRDGVRGILRGESRPPIPPGRSPPKLSAEQIEAALGRLLVLSPCYSIESWLYHATTEIREYCQAKHSSVEHGKLIESWESNKQLLDEVFRPKDDALPCVGDQHNELLSKTFPAEKVWIARRSFYEFVETLRACSPLINALGHEEAV